MTKETSKIRSLIVVFCIITVLIATAVGVGCYYGGRNATTEPPTPLADNSIVSYVSKETRVFSSTSEVVQAVADSVVEIKTESVATKWGTQYIVSGAGSGVIVAVNDSTYYIVTNNHVISGANEITVTTRSGDSYKATLVATDDSADIAVITVDSEKELLVAIWGNSDELSIGEDLIAIGNPLGSLGGTVTKGILSATGRTITVGNYAMTLLQTDTAINPGNSGGGLFNMRGELIGVVNAKTTDEEIEGICFAIPSNTAKDVYDDLVSYGYIVGRATLGIGLQELTSSSMMQSQKAVCVISVSGTDENKFKQYDRIHSINGEEISSILEYNIALSKIKPNDTVKVEVYRGTINQDFFGSSISFASEITSFEVEAQQYGIN